MRACHPVALAFAAFLTPAAVPCLNSQGVPLKARPLVARVTQHSDVELVDVSIGQTRTIYKRSEWFSKDVSMSPDGRYVAFVQYDPGIERGVSVRLSQPVALVILDTSGSAVRRITEK